MAFTTNIAELNAARAVVQMPPDALADAAVFVNGQHVGAIPAARWAEIEVVFLAGIPLITRAEVTPERGGRVTIRMSTIADA